MLISPRSVSCLAMPCVVDVHSIYIACIPSIEVPWLTRGVATSFKRSLAEWLG